MSRVLPLDMKGEDVALLPRDLNAWYRHCGAHPGGCAGRGLLRPRQGRLSSRADYALATATAGVATARRSLASTARAIRQTSSEPAAISANVPRAPSAATSSPPPK